MASLHKTLDLPSAVLACSPPDEQVIPTPERRTGALKDAPVDRLGRRPYDFGRTKRVYGASLVMWPAAFFRRSPQWTVRRPAVALASGIPYLFVQTH